MIYPELHYDIAKNKWYYIIPFGGTRYVSEDAYTSRRKAKRAMKTAARRAKKYGDNWSESFDV